MSCETAAQVHPAARASQAPGATAMTSGVGAARRLVPGRLELALPAWRRQGRFMTGVLVLAGAYYAAAKLGYALEFSGPVAAIVWLPAGVAIAFLSVGGLRFWPGVLMGDLLANDYSVVPLGSALGQTFGNMVEVLVAALLIRRLLVRGSPLDSLGGIARLLGAIAAGTAISATVGPLSLWVGRRHQHQRTAGGGSHLVAGRRRRRVDRDSARARLVPPAGSWLDAWSGSGGAADARRGSGDERDRVPQPDAAGLSRLPRPGLGRGALRPPRRHARDRRRGRLRGLEHHALSRTVRVRLDLDQRAQYPALHRRGGAGDAVPRRARRRAQAVRRAARRLTRPARQGVGHRATTARTQPARRRPTAPHRARHPARARRQSRPRGPRAGGAGTRRRPQTRWSSRSTSYASSRGASIHRS